MKLIEEGQLVHVDNMDDVLLHLITDTLYYLQKQILEYYLRVN